MVTAKPKKKSTRGKSVSMVEFRNPRTKDKMFVDVHGWGGGPFTEHGFDPSIPARFTVSVLIKRKGDPYKYLVFTEDKYARIPSRNSRFPKHVTEALFKKGVAICRKRGYTMSDKTQTASARHKSHAFMG